MTTPMPPLEFAGADRDGWLTVTEAAYYLGRHRKTVQTWCAAGTITRRKGGGVKQPRYLIHRSTIRALIEAEKAAA